MSPVSQHAKRSMVTRRVYELWRDVDGTYAFFPRDGDGLAPAGELVWSVEAASWEEAVRAQREYLGWGG
jgi:hypothetical protein